MAHIGLHLYFTEEGH